MSDLYSPVSLLPRGISTLVPSKPRTSRDTIARAKPGRRESNAVSRTAGMSVLWGQGCKIPDDTMNIAEKIHDYLEFNLTSRLSPAPDEPARFGLTSREVEVVELLCCGRTNREIGECLSIGLATVKTHLIHIFEKLGVETRSAVVALMSRPH